MTIVKRRREWFSGEGRRTLLMFWNYLFYLFENVTMNLISASTIFSEEWAIR